MTGSWLLSTYKPVSNYGEVSNNQHFLAASGKNDPFVNIINDQLLADQSPVNKPISTGPMVSSSQRRKKN